MGKNHKKIRMKQEAAAEVGGFLSGSDDDFDEEENFKLKEDRGKKRKGSESEDEFDEEVEVSPKKVPKVQPAKIPSDGNSSGEEGDDNDGNDEVEDLKLEDLDSDSDADLQDDFGASNDGGDDDDDDDSSDDEDEEESE